MIAELTGEAAFRAGRVCGAATLRSLDWSMKLLNVAFVHQRNEWKPGWFPLIGPFAGPLAPGAYGFGSPALAGLRTFRWIGLDA